MDLNLIRIFSTVYEEGSVTAAAERLRLSQPTVTQALNRLRRETGEALFERAGRGITPTRSANQLYHNVGHLASAVEAAVHSLSHFDPITTVETFRLALTDLGQMVFLPVIVPALAQSAPHSTLDVVNLDMNTAPDDLVAGRIDMAVASTVLPGRLRSMVIRADVYRCVTRVGRFGIKPPPFEELSVLPRVIARDTLGHTLIENLLPAAPQGSVYLPGFSAIPAAVAASDLIAFVPSAGIDSWKVRGDLEAWPLPEGTSTALVRAHTALQPASAASAWFAAWATDQLRRTPRASFQ